jgi:hypothetical protein
MQAHSKEEVREMARKKSATRSASIPSSAWEKGESSEKPDPASAGQSGDLQGLSDVPSANSESVTELLEEGQAFEAGIVSGVENAPPADEEEVTVTRLPVDDVPLEYVQDKDEPKE